MQIFYENHGLTPLRKTANFAPFWIRCFYRLERLSFYLDRHKRLFGPILSNKQKIKKRDQFFTKTME